MTQLPPPSHTSWRFQYHPIALNWEQNLSHQRLWESVQGPNYSTNTLKSRLLMGLRQTCARWTSVRDPASLRSHHFPPVGSVCSISWHQRAFFKALRLLSPSVLLDLPGASILWDLRSSGPPVPLLLSSLSLLTVTISLQLRQRLYEAREKPQWVVRTCALVC